MVHELATLIDEVILGSDQRSALLPTLDTIVQQQCLLAVGKRLHHQILITLDNMAFGRDD